MYLSIIVKSVKQAVAGIVPKPLWPIYRLMRHRNVRATTLRFLLNRSGHLGLPGRAVLFLRLWRISSSVDCPHDEHEILSFIEAILAAPEAVQGCVVEAGTYKGGSAAKFSLAARRAHRRLVVFDSFEGIPQHNESHTKNILGWDVDFPPGSYAGSLEEVKRNIGLYGCLQVCDFVKGWFEETMTGFNEPIIAAYLDVDLASSTRTCLKYLYPLVAPGGVLYSQDGHLPLVSRP